MNNLNSFKYATCPVEFDEADAQPNSDSGPLFYMTKEEAEKEIAKALAENFTVMALLTVEGFYRAKPIAIEKI